MSKTYTESEAAYWCVISWLLGCGGGLMIAGLLLASK